MIFFLFFGAKRGKRILQSIFILDAKYIGQRVIQSNGYRYLVNQLIDSPEYKEKFGTSLVPGNGTCPQSFC